jgi:two-component system response regulator YesN
MMDRRIQLLIADDEVQIRNGLKFGINWKSIGIETVYIAQDGLQAYQLCEENKIELVLTDIRMPGIDGLELAARLTYHPCHVVIITGFDDFSYAQNAIRSHVRDYLLKPVKIPELMECVGNLVKEIQAEKCIYQMNNEKTLSCPYPGLASHQKFFGKDMMLDLANNNLNSTILLSLDYINCHYNEKIGVEDVARHINKSKNYFSTSFRRATGYPFVQYLTILRIENAKRLLLTTSLMTSEIAGKVGFGDYKYFSIIFHHLVGCAPSQFRKKGLKNEN